MNIEQQLNVWSWAVALAWWVPLFVPVLYAFAKPGHLSRKAMYVLCACAASWALSVALFVVVVVPVLWANEPLSRAILADPEHSPVLRLLRATTQTVNSYWYFVGQIAVPIVAALTSIPMSFILSRRLLPEPHGTQRVA